MKKLKFTAVIMSVLAAAALFSGCSDNEENSNNSGSVVYYDNSSNQYVAPEEKDQIAKDNAQSIEGKLSEKAIISGFDVKMNKVVCVGMREKDDRNKVNSQLISAEFEITNNNSDALKVSSMGDFTITIDNDKTVLGSDSYSAVTAARTIEDYESLDYTIEPQQTVRGYISFAVDEGWKNITVTYTPQSKEISYDKLYYNITPDVVEDITQN